jgi:hypothetical protein
MKTSIFPLSALSLAFFLVVLSCKDDETPGPQPEQFRIKTLARTASDNPNVKHISSFKYDAGGRLASIFTYQIPDSATSPNETSTYQYDAQNRVSQMDRVLSKGGSERYVYTYNQAGKPDKIKYTGGTNDYFDLIFNYDPSGQLSSSKRTFNFANTISYDQTNAFIFANGNLGKVTTTTTVVRTVPSSTTYITEFVYDDHPNPFFEAPVIPAPSRIATPSTGSFNYYSYYGGIDNLLQLSKNNLLSATTDALSKITYAYTYNAQNLPESRTTSQKANPSAPVLVLELLEYGYEEY